MEAYRILGVARARDGDRLIDELCNARRVKGSGHDAGFARVFKPLLFCLGLAQNDAVYAELERTLDHVGLITAQHDAVGVVEQKRIAALRQRNDDVAGDAVEKLCVLIEYLALEHAQHIVKRNIVDVRIDDGQQAVRRDISGRESAVQGAVLVYDGNDGHLLLAHHAPGSVHRDRGVQRRGRIEIKVAHLRAHVVYLARRLKAEFIEHALSLVAYMSKAGRSVFSVAEGVAKRRIAHRRNDRVGVRITVAYHENFIHYSFLRFWMLHNYSM